MELKDYNLKVVTIERRGFALQPISNCVISGREYMCNPDETAEEKLYIPVEELKFGCAISIKQQKKTYIIKIEEFLWKWYVKIWEMPYKENADYSQLEIFEFMRKNHVQESILMISLL